MTDTVGPEHGPVVEEFKHRMNAVAAGLDDFLNGDARPKQIGFCLLMFPFADAASPHQDRLNYISNADAVDMLALFKEMVARLEYRLHRGGRA